MTRAGRRLAGLAVLLGAVVGLTACSSGSSPPQVASLGSSGATGSASGGGAARSTASRPAGNATQLLDTWAACMRSHGDPTQTDPTIDTDKVIHITMRNVSAALSDEAHGSTGPCNKYELAAENALRGGQPPPQAPSLAAQLKFAQCMRANGVPNYPDPSGSDDTNLRGAGIDTSTPAYQDANQLCVKKTGMPAYWATGTGVPGEVEVQSCNPPPGRQCPSGGPGAGGGGPGANG
jgi:hypothetical protein